MRLSKKTRKALSRIGIGMMFTVGGIAGILTSISLIIVAFRRGAEVGIFTGLIITFWIGGLLAVVFDD